MSFYLGFGVVSGAGGPPCFLPVFLPLVFFFKLCYYYFVVKEEKKETLSEIFPEEVPLVERKERLEVLPETEPYLEAIEKELHTIKPVRDSWGKIIAQPPAPQKVKITLPISRQQYLAGFHQPVVNSIRWLVAWVRRLVKMVPEKVVFRGAKVRP